MSILFSILVGIPLFVLGAMGLTLAGFAFMIWDNGPWPHGGES